MFSSNQKLLISGSLDLFDIREALFFGITKAARSNNYCFQISTDDKQFCIGAKYGDELPKGWNDFSFDFDIDIVARVIKQHLEKQEIQYENQDGSYEKGFLMKNIESNYKEKIKNSFYGIVSFEPYTNFYSK